MKLGILSRSAFLPLRDAMLCIDCEFITPATSDKCSVCGSLAVINLRELLGALIEEASRVPDGAGLAELSTSLVGHLASGQRRISLLPRSS
jgi:RNA polymerase subunit RPABC4/transcription elongation factor Spt4